MVFFEMFFAVIFVLIYCRVVIWGSVELGGFSFGGFRVLGFNWLLYEFRGGLSVYI